MIYTRPTEDRDHAQAAACRRLWSSVVLHALNDWWSRVEKGDGDREAVREEARRYFNSRDGKTVLALAGVTADPEKLADVAADPTARARTLLGDAA